MKRVINLDNWNRKEINKLPENKLDFLVEFIEILKNMK